jgi:hypothetical protein
MEPPRKPGRISSSWTRQSVASQPTETSSGPFTPTVPAAADTAARPVIAPNLPIGSKASANRLQRLTRPTSAPFRARASAPVSGQLCGRPLEVRPSSRVPVAFRPAGVGFLGHPVPAGEFGSPCGRLTGHAAVPGPRRGFHVPHAQDATGEGAPSAPERRCPTAGSMPTSRRLPLPSGQSYTPALQPTHGAHLDEASSGVHSRSPVRSSPRL